LGHAFRPNARPPPSPEERAILAHRAAIASATDAGCRAPNIAPMRAEPGGPATTGGIIDPSLPVGRGGEIFTIAFATFIPANHLVAPSLHPQSYGRLVSPLRLAFAGDDRGFGVDAPSSPSTDCDI
jgi:hypothetical protein